MTQFETIQREAKELFRKKNADYGDAFATYGTVGVLVRLGDKIHRIQSITNKGITLNEDEKLRDTLMDLHNYAAMALMLLDENRQGYDTPSSPDSPDSPHKTLTEKWTIIGETHRYERTCTTDNNGNTTNTCSCPSFTYCRAAKRTCKHIENPTQYKTVD